MENAADHIGSESFAAAIRYLLTETFEGSPEGRPSAYLDRGIGVFKTLGGLSAAEASVDFRGTTIAAQTEHTKFYLDRICEFLNGRKEPVNWEDSWLIETVNDAEWAALVASAIKSYQSAIICIGELTVWSQPSLGMALGLVAHSAYHLGAIRQLVKSLPSRDRADAAH